MRQILTLKQIGPIEHIGPINPPAKIKLLIRASPPAETQDRQLYCAASEAHRFARGWGPDVDPSPTHHAAGVGRARISDDRCADMADPLLAVAPLLRQAGSRLIPG